MPSLRRIAVLLAASPLDGSALARRRAAKSRLERRALGAPGRRKAVSDARRPAPQLERLALGAAAGVGVAGGAAREHGRSACLLGAGRGPPGRLRLDQRGRDRHRGPPAWSSRRAPVVRDVEERQHALRPAVGEDRHEALPAGGPGRRRAHRRPHADLEERRSTPTRRPSRR